MNFPIRLRRIFFLTGFFFLVISSSLLQTLSLFHVLPFASGAVTDFRPVLSSVLVTQNIYGGSFHGYYGFICNPSELRFVSLLPLVMSSS